MENQMQDNGHRVEARIPVARREETRRALVADDDREMRKLIAWALHRAGFIVDECHDGTVLMRMLDRSRSRSTNVAYDLVISDIRMPGLTGLEVLALAGAHEDRPPILLISAFCDAETEDRARRLGADGLLPKPFATEDLLAKVRELAPAPAPARDARQGATPAARHDGAAGVDPDAGLFPLDVSFRHMDADDSLRDLARHLAGRLESARLPIRRCRVIIDRRHAPESGPQAYLVSLVISIAHRAPVVVEEDVTYADGDRAVMAALHDAFATAAEALARKGGQS